MSAKLAKDLEPYDRLSITGEAVLTVQIVGGDVIVATERQLKTFSFGQIVFLKKS